jgi:hypothetical protein
VTIGVVAAVAIVPASAYIGAYLDKRANPDADLAGLAGMVGGGMVGFAIVFIASITTIAGGRWRRRPMIIGIGQGMAIAMLLVLLALGICSVVT